MPAKKKAAKSALEYICSQIVVSDDDDGHDDGSIVVDDAVVLGLGSALQQSAKVYDETTSDEKTGSQRLAEAASAQAQVELDRARFKRKSSGSFEFDAMKSKFQNKDA